VIATALVAAVGDAKAFTSGRHLAAWLGLVPRQRSSGGEERLLGISKQGDGYLRRQLLHGARALVRVSPGREGRLWSWVNGLRARRAFNVVVAAVANKPARILWAVLSRGETYRAAVWAGPRRRAGTFSGRSTEGLGLTGSILPRKASTGCEGGHRGWHERSDRGRRSPRLSQGREPERMIGSRPADLIEADGRRPSRPNGWQQPRPECQPRRKPLRSGRRPWMGK